jgi:hypothetical protein
MLAISRPVEVAPATLVRDEYGPIARENLEAIPFAVTLIDSSTRRLVLMTL